MFNVIFAQNVVNNVSKTHGEVCGTVAIGVSSTIINTIMLYAWLEYITLQSIQFIVCQPSFTVTKPPIHLPLWYSSYSMV